MSMDVNKDIAKAIEDAKNVPDESTREYIKKCFREELFEIMGEHFDQKVYVIYYPQKELYRGDYGFVNDVNDAQKFGSKEAARIMLRFDEYKKQIPYDGEIIFYGWRNRELWLKD